MTSAVVRLTARLTIGFVLLLLPVEQANAAECVPAQTFIRAGTPRVVVNETLQVPFVRTAPLTREYPLCVKYFDSEVFTVRFVEWQDRVVVLYADPHVGPVG